LTVNLTPEQIKQILNAHHANSAKIQAENTEADKPLQNFKAIMARNRSRHVTTKKAHTCHTCHQTIQKGTQATYTPGRIAARSSRNTDATFTASTYTCTSCMEKQ